MTTPTYHRAVLWHIRGNSTSLRGRFARHQIDELACQGERSTDDRAPC